MGKVSPENIRFLKELQRLDLEIMELEARKRNVPSEITDLLHRIEAVKKDAGDLAAEIKSISENKRECDQVLEDRLATLEKLRSQKNLVSTNAAYTALLKEIEAAEREQNKAEEDILTYMERAEELSESAGKRKAELADCERALAVLKEENEKRINVLDGELEVLFKERSQKTSGVGGSLLDLYEKTRKTKGGPAFVAALEDGCSGCNMALRAQTISELMKGEVLVCESCSRILYMECEQIGS